ncbi:MAG: hypothetical protein IPL49_05480 [Saprospirales bacterium]|nr:hypothetical protein [Saprospirales bacterium]MBK8490360.1 hypothetical protein [Saprospirales bacterium]
MRWQQKLLISLIALALLGLVVVYVFEFYYFQRTFHVQRLLLTGALIGAGVGAALGWRFSRVVEDSVERIQVYVFCIVLAVIFTPLLVSLSNRLLSPHPVQWEDVLFFEEKPYISERFGILKDEKVQTAGYHLFYSREGEIYRMDNRHKMGVSLKRGDIFQIPVRQGLWGFSWVLSDRKPWSHPNFSE